MTAVTLSAGDRSIFGYSHMDARPLYVLVAVLAVLAIRVPRLRPWWLFVMSLTTLGRAVSLVALGSPDLPRSAELRAALGWLLLWLLGILAVLVLEAAMLLRETTPTTGDRGLTTGKG